ATTTTASGMVGLSSFPITGCGNVSGGPWSFTYTWRNGTQPSSPASQVEGPDAVQVAPLGNEVYEAVKVD
ncbi:MAG: hypothetical protein Q7O66_23065, partial [Dehalococcoidia bacterium]|nr:hypothetical protein [Dehalococcoidia bacterium]